MHPSSRAATRMLLLCASLTAGLAARPAFAQAPPTVTAEVVVTATVAPVPAASVGRTVFTLTRDDLQRFGVTSVIDGLRLLPGVDVKARGPHDVQADFSLRGATFGQALVLLDGVRLNDAQSGHHNGEIPAPLVGVDRIEVVAGPASAVHGADAFGGTIQVLTRRGRHLTGQGAFGEHRTVSAQVSSSGHVLPAAWTVAAWGARSDGFMFDRDYAQGGGSLRGTVSSSVTMDVRHQRRAFGANGFYGNSPSKEWTDGTVISTLLNRQAGGWTTQARVAWRNHGDHFRWDINRPGFAENRHRTNALDADLTLGRSLGAALRLTAGGGGGGDWITSSNLGDHTYGRAYAFAEALWAPAARVSVQSAVRFDHYSTFGDAWSPSLSAAVQVSGRVRLRASAARAFRIPTFTERFYTDPAHLASDTLAPERGWALDSGLDVQAGRWTLSATPFIRWDEDVIDWIRGSTAERWRTTNVRDVTTRGLEWSASGRFTGALVRAHVTLLDVDAPKLTMLSKYVLDYAPRSAGLSVAVPLAARVVLSATADGRDRLDGQQYVLLGARLTRPVGRVDVFVEGSNLLDEAYREIGGVPMPGRWVSAGIRLR